MNAPWIISIVELLLIKKVDNEDTSFYKQKQHKELDSIKDERYKKT